MYQQKALNILRAHSAYGQPLEFHCLRLAQFSLALARQRQVTMDPDLIHAACFLHDIGLCVDDPSQRNYLKRGRNFALTQIADCLQERPPGREWNELLQDRPGPRAVEWCVLGGELMLRRQCLRVSWCALHVSSLWTGARAYGSAILLISARCRGKTESTRNQREGELRCALRRSPPPSI